MNNMMLVLSELPILEQDFTKEALKLVGELSAKNVPVIGSHLMWHINERTLELSAQPKLGVIIYEVVNTAYLFETNFDEDNGWYGNEENITYVQVKFIKYMATSE